MFPVFGAGLVPEKRVEVFRGTDPAADSKTGCVQMILRGGVVISEIIRENNLVLIVTVSVMFLTQELESVLSKILLR